MTQTQQKYYSDDIIVEHIVEFQALASIIIDVGNLEREYALSDVNSVTYQYSSCDFYAIQRLNQMWQEYKQTGVY